MRKNKIPLKKVQIAFSNAIKRRDMRCMVQNYEPCSGELETSHFFTQGANPSIMFYPPNAYAQCSHHHYMHHNGKMRFYEQWIITYHSAAWLRMQKLRHGIIHYTDGLKSKIIELCNNDQLEELKELIEKEIQPC